jgi:O-antigen ligase
VTGNVAVIGGVKRRSVNGYAGRAFRFADVEWLAVAAASVVVALLPLLRPAGPRSTAPVDALILLALVAALLWLGRDRRPIRFPYAIPVGLFLLGGALGAISGPIPGSGAVALLQDIALLLWFWVLINIGSSAERLQVIVRVWAYAAIAWAVLLLGSIAAGISAISGQTEAEGVRTALTLGNPNYAGNYFFVSIMIVWAAGRPRSRVARLAAYAVLLAALISTGSNGALIAFAVATVVAGLVGVYRRAGLVAATTALAGVVLAGACLTWQYDAEDVQSRASQSNYAFIRDGVGRSEKTGSDRGVLARQGFDLYRSGGPLGTGPGSTKVRLKNEHANRAVEAHNDYLAAVNERGVIGLLGVLFLLTGVSLQALSLARAPAGAAFARAIVRPNALVGAVAGTLVAMTATEYLHVRHVWTLLAVVVAAALVARK